MLFRSDDLSKLDFKQGDSLKQAVKAQTTDKLIVFATNGRFFTLEASQLPGGRGHGEPVRLMVDLEENHDFVEMFVHEPGRKLLVCSTGGYGFVVPEDEVVAQTKNGKQVLKAVKRVDVPRVLVLTTTDLVGRARELAAGGRMPERSFEFVTIDGIRDAPALKDVIMQSYARGGLDSVLIFGDEAKIPRSEEHTSELQSH